MIERNTEVIPTLGRDDAGEVGVGEDDPGVGTPCSTQVYVPRPTHDARHERVAGLRIGRQPFLRGDGAIGRGNGVKVAFLHVQTNNISWN